MRLAFSVHSEWKTQVRKVGTCFNVLSLFSYIKSLVPKTEKNLLVRIEKKEITQNTVESASLFARYNLR